MTSALLLTGLLMGLAGGPHCLAMCGVGCAAVTRATGGTGSHTALIFHLSRISGYGVLGGVAGASAQSIGWLTAQTAVMRPVWTVLLLATFSFGFWLMASARQPAWLELMGRRVWGQVKVLTTRWGRGAPFVLGGLWAFMPCGLLYSALLVAMLSGDAINGAATMLLFGLGSTLVMTVGATLVRRVLRHAQGNGLQGWIFRAAGLVVVSASLWSLWMLAHSDTGFWCFSS
jgi:uncharacterized protein